MCINKVDKKENPLENEMYGKPNIGFIVYELFYGICRSPIF